MTGLSCVPVAGKDTNLFSLHRRPINRRSHGRSTCCGSEKKFRNVQIRYARCTRFGCTYRGPIGVSSSRTPSLSFSIHIDLAHLEKDGQLRLCFLKRAPEMGQWEVNFRGGSWIKLRKSAVISRYRSLTGVLSVNAWFRKLSLNGKDEAGLFPATAVWRTRPWLLSGWGRRSRRLSRA